MLYSRKNLFISHLSICIRVVCETSGEILRKYKNTEKKIENKLRKKNKKEDSNLEKLKKRPPQTR